MRQAAVSGDQVLHYYLITNQPTFHQTGLCLYTVYSLIDILIDFHHLIALSLLHYEFAYEFTIPYCCTKTYPTAKV